MYIRLHLKYSLCSTDFRKILMSDFTKIRAVGTELFHADGRTDTNTVLLYFCLYRMFTTIHIQNNTIHKPHFTTFIEGI